MAFRSANLDHVAKFNSARSCHLVELYKNEVDSEILKSHSRIPHRTFAPSSLRCERMSWFRLRGVEPDAETQPDAQLDFVANMGTACHELLQRRLISAMKLSENFEWIDVAEYLNVIGIDEQYNVQSSGYETLVEFPDVPVRFAVDGIIKVGEEHCLLEIKSSEYSTWNDLVNPRDEHIAQITAYCTLLHLSTVFFIYIDRQYGDIKSYEIKVSDADKQNLMDMFVRVKQYAEYGIAPEPLPKGDKWCSPSYCQYYHKCAEYGR